MGGLVLLPTFDLSDCESLASLPESLGQCIRLTEIILAGNGGLAALPSSIGDLANLTTLRVVDCASLATLPGSIGQVCVCVLVCTRNDSIVPFIRC